MRDAVSGHRFPERYEHSRIYKNLGSNKFKDVTEALGLQANMWNGDVSFGDVNGDGWPDLYFLNMQGDDHYFENQGGQSFVDKTKQVFPMTPWGSMFALWTTNYENVHNYSIAQSWFLFANCGFGDPLSLNDLEISIHRWFQNVIHFSAGPSNLN